MASILIRGLDDSVKQQLAERAATHGTSMEAEARKILTSALVPSNVGLAFLEVGRRHHGVEELEIAPREIIPGRAIFE